MTAPIVECIPNFSEARRPEVVEAIAEAVQSVPAVTLLDRHSDLDHNRTVLTFVGPPVDIEEAAFRAIARAAELIDLDKHRGEHPRIGATDVVPFVPISNISMQACVEIARRLGQRVGQELGIPVYLYEEAASRPERRNLEDIRRGGYEALKEEIGKEAERNPDFGPLKVGQAGATVIGARHPLIAYNVYLDTDRVDIAKKVAKAVRHSSGGLRYVKALGLSVEGQAQVSMNLTNFRATPMARVVEMIRLEAARYGTSIHHSELVGLIPQEALVEAARWYLQLDQFEPDQILESRLVAAPQQAHERTPTPTTSSKDFLDALASNTPAPGGGSASAYSGAAGAALVSMVARLTIGKKQYSEVEEQMKAVLLRSEELRSELTRAIEEDAAAFFAILEAFMLPKDTPEAQARRSEAIQSATLGAARVPLDVARKAVEVMELSAQVVECGNRNAISDGATGAVMARAALSGAGYNVRINLSSLKDETIVVPMLAELRELENRADQFEERIREMLSERGRVSLA
jgi:glutamate formiminotransferase/formiminotetrahydrofolate cyclodeaminase